MRGGFRRCLAVLVLLGSVVPGAASAAAYRDELTFLARTTFLFREYSLVVPVDIKRQPLPGAAFVEIKAWGAWNGSWVPYIYEPITVPGVTSDDLNSVISRYRQVKPETNLDIRKGRDSAFTVHYETGRTRFDMQTKGFIPRVTHENPEGRLAMGVSDAHLNLNGHQVAGRVVAVLVIPTSQGDGTGRYGLYDHFTLQLPSGAILVVYHSRNRPGFNLIALLTSDGKGDRQGRRVQVTWQKLWRDTETGREIPTAWVIDAPEVGVKADLTEWGRNLVRYKTDAGKLAVVANVMVRGSVQFAGASFQVFGLNVHVQDE